MEVMMISISPLTIANFRLLHCLLARCKILPASLIRLDLIMLIRGQIAFAPSDLDVAAGGAFYADDDCSK